MNIKIVLPFIILGLIFSTSIFDFAEAQKPDQESAKQAREEVKEAA